MLVAGRSFSFSTHTYTGLIARFNSNGSVDTTFGTNGSTSASISGVFSLAVQTDRKILAGGSQGNDPAFAIEWPIKPVVISDKDSAWPAFAPPG